jgi:hypothetical protein
MSEKFTPLTSADKRGKAYSSIFGQLRNPWQAVASTFSIPGGLKSGTSEVRFDMVASEVVKAAATWVHFFLVRFEEKNSSTWLRTFSSICFDSLASETALERDREPTQAL